MVPFPITTVRGAADQCDPVDIAAAESRDVVGTVLHRVRVFWHKFVSARRIIFYCQEFVSVV